MTMIKIQQQQVAQRLACSHRNEIKHNRLMHHNESGIALDSDRTLYVQRQQSRPNTVKLIMSTTMGSWTMIRDVRKVPQRLHAQVSHLHSHLWKQSPRSDRHTPTQSERRTFDWLPLFSISVQHLISFFYFKHAPTTSCAVTLHASFNQSTASTISGTRECCSSRTTANIQAKHHIHGF